MLNIVAFDHDLGGGGANGLSCGEKTSNFQKDTVCDHPL